MLFDYAATARVRHPSFEAVVADHRARQGLPALQGDDLQYARVLALGNQRPVMPIWRCSRNAWPFPVCALANRPAVTSSNLGQDRADGNTPPRTRAKTTD